MCFGSNRHTPAESDPDYPESADYPGGAEGDTAYKEAMRHYWHARYRHDKSVKNIDEAAGKQVELAMRTRYGGFAEQLEMEAREARAGPNRPARAIVYDVKTARKALARSRAGMLATGTLGQPGAYGPRKTLLGGA